MKINKIVPIILFTMLAINYSHANQTYTKNLFPTKNGGLTITSPEYGTTVTGDNLSISGTSSHPNCIIRLMLNNTLVGSTLTEGDGSWSFDSLNLPDGNYAVKTEIFGTLSGNFCILASATSNFNVLNNPIISISTPVANEINQIFYTNISGYTTLSPSCIVRISIDGTATDTTITDSAGYWETDFPALENGDHTLFVELLSEGITIATETIVFTSLCPTYIWNNSQLRLVEGNIPTSGSGSGYDFIYNVVGDVATITFSQEFSSIPTVIATGQYASGTSNITISALSNSSCSLTFSAGTERIHFCAREFL
ncbi:hypothetical protein ACFLYU_01100 [Candidatus Dependentiae bacterium]